jgi:hypothetical protein
MNFLYKRGQTARLFIPDATRRRKKQKKALLNAGLRTRHGKARLGDSPQRQRPKGFFISRKGVFNQENPAFI